MRVVDKTLSPLFVNIVGTLLMFALFGVILGLYSALWHENPLVIYAQSRALTGTLFISLVIFFISVVIHEAIHSIGYRMGGAAWSEIKFGFQWQSLMPYAHCKVPLRASAYRLAVMLPGVLLGLIPAVIGIMARLDWLTLYGTAMLAGAVGDVMILALLMPLKADTLVQDHPSKPGFQIIVDS